MHGAHSQAVIRAGGAVAGGRASGGRHGAAQIVGGEGLDALGEAETTLHVLTDGGVWLDDLGNRWGSSSFLVDAVDVCVTARAVILIPAQHA